jgi:hypothetical protein
MSGHSIKLVDPDATTRSVQSVNTQEAVTANFTQTDEGPKAISTIPLVGTSTVSVQQSDEVFMLSQGGDASSLQIYNAGNFSLVNQIQLGMAADKMFIENDIGYFFGDGFEIYNLANPYEPVLIFSDPQAFYDPKLDTKKAVLPLIHESILYLVSQDDVASFSFSVTDYKNPNAPRLLSYEPNSLNELPQRMAVSENVLALSDSNGISLFDILDMTKIAFLSAIALVGINDLLMVDGILTAFSANTVTKINIENPRKPFIVERQISEAEEQVTRRQAKAQLLTKQPTRLPTRRPTTRAPSRAPTRKITQG